MKCLNILAGQTDIYIYIYIYTWNLFFLYLVIFHPPKPGSFLIKNKGPIWVAGIYIYVYIYIYMYFFWELKDGLGWHHLHLRKFSSNLTGR